MKKKPFTASAMDDSQHPDDVAAEKESIAYAKEAIDAWFEKHRENMKRVISTYSDGEAEDLFWTLREAFWIRDDSHITEPKPRPPVGCACSDGYGPVAPYCGTAQAYQSAVHDLDKTLHESAPLLLRVVRAAEAYVRSISDLAAFARQGASSLALLAEQERTLNEIRAALDALKEAT